MSALCRRYVGAAVTAAMAAALSPPLPPSPLPLPRQRRLRQRIGSTGQLQPQLQR
jgi:hypothetical protein